MSIIKKTLALSATGLGYFVELAQPDSNTSYRLTSPHAAAEKRIQLLRRENIYI